MRFKRNFLIIVIFWISFIDLYGEIHVCVTTSLIADMVTHIAGSHVKLSQLMGPGVDPHLYKATLTDSGKLSTADIIFYNGLHLEGRMIDIFEGLIRQGKSVFAISDGIEKSSLIALKGNTGYDPHIWFDPRLWAQCVDIIVNALKTKEKDPQKAQFYETQGNAFKEKLNALYTWGTEQTVKLTKTERILITSHDAYNYFGRAFEFQVIGVQGVSTVSEAGGADILSTVDFIQKHHVKSIFVESSVSPAAIERISEDSGVAIGGELFSDSLGTKDEKLRAGKELYDVGTYEGMFKYNMETIIHGLKIDLFRN